NRRTRSSPVSAIWTGTGSRYATTKPGNGWCSDGCRAVHTGCDGCGAGGRSPGTGAGHDDAKRGAVMDAVMAVHGLLAWIGGILLVMLAIVKAVGAVDGEGEDGWPARRSTASAVGMGCGLAPHPVCSAER